jgi:hypothetical protein
VRILHMTDLLFELVENLRCDMVFIKQAFSSAYYLLRTEYCSEEVGACPRVEMTGRHGDVETKRHDTQYARRLTHNAILRLSQFRNLRAAAGGRANLYQVTSLAPRGRG